MEPKQYKNYIAGIYLRLSRDDERRAAADTACLQSRYRLGFITKQQNTLHVITVYPIKYLRGSKRYG